LFYRLNVFPVFVPPLRERAGDVPALARHFIGRFAAEEHKAVSGMSQEAAGLIERYTWPGNVRQLENTIFRAVVLSDGTMLDTCDFPQIAAALGVETGMRSRAPEAAAPALQTAAPASPYALPVTGGDGHVRKYEDLEKDIIRLAIARYDGHMSEVARRLGIGRSTLYRKLKEYGLDDGGEAEAPEPREAAG
jgi:DNA-binding NtrC family response regulator